MSDSHNHSSHSIKNIRLALILNFTFTIIELVGGILTQSTAILSDAIHDLGDTIALLTSYVFEKTSNSKGNEKYTYGLKRLSLLSAGINGVVLFAGSVYILFEAIPKLFSPVQPHTEGMLYLAILGVCVNGYAAYKINHGKTQNEKILTWHLMEDVLGWVAVLIISIVMMFVDLPILDPILAICITLVIMFGAIKNSIRTLTVFLRNLPVSMSSQLAFPSL